MNDLDLARENDLKYLEQNKITRSIPKIQKSRAR